MSQTTNETGILSDAARLLKFIGEHKGTAGLLVPMIYFLGYLGWSIQSFFGNIGPLPALNTQYFITGVAIAAVAIASFAMYRLLRKIPLRIEATIRRSAHGGRYMQWLLRFVTVVSLVALAYILAFLYFVFVSFPSMPRVFEPPRWLIASQGYFLILLVAAGLAGWIVHIGMHFRETPTLVGVLFNAPLFISTTAGLVLLIATLAWVLPHLPQALGGVQPRCAFLYFDETEYAHSLPSQLFTRVRNEPPYLTDRLDVLYSDGDSLLVRPQSERLSGFTYELSRDRVALIEWCGGASIILGNQ